MPENSFDRYRDDNRGWLWTGIAALVIAAVAAIVAGVVAMNREPAPVEVVAAPTTTLVAPAAADELIGVYSGEVVSPEGATRTAVVALTGAQGLVTYPKSGCQAYLSGAEADDAAVRYKAESLAKCPADGTWVFTRTDTGVHAKYVEGTAVRVSGDLHHES